MRRALHFFFDYVSSTSYFGWLGAERLCRERDLDLVLHPVLFAGLLNHWGQLGPAEVEPKRAWVCRDGLRRAALLGAPFACPRYHPFNPLLPLRVSLAEVAGDQQRRVVDTLWQKGWGEGIDLGSPAEIRQALNDAGLDGGGKLLDAAGAPAAKYALRADTNDAIERGVFGVPTFVVDGELFWGSDRFDHLELFLDGRDPLDRDALEDILRRPRKAHRRI